MCVHGGSTHLAHRRSDLIEFRTHSSHALAGQMIDLPDIPANELD
ncbi:hypothetical protein [Azospirillum aestuarii]